MYIGHRAHQNPLIEAVILLAVRRLMPILSSERQSPAAVHLCCQAVRGQSPNTRVSTYRSLLLEL
eukprot:2132745-Pleurochrysis_carterae.AAC.1